jgi:hypothetical protein
MEIEILQAIAHDIHRIADAQSPAKQTLGFGPAPKSQVYVFCNRNKGGVWYTLNSESQPVNIEQPALTGIIRKLEFKETVRRGEKSHKLHCYIEADQLYVLEGSAAAHFSKGLLSALAMLTPEQLRQPITLVPQPSTENAEVLFCNVYQNGKQIYAPYDEQTQWKTVSRTALNAVRMANPDPAQSTSQAVPEAA